MCARMCVFACVRDDMRVRACMCVVGGVVVRVCAVRFVSMWACVRVQRAVRVRWDWRCVSMCACGGMGACTCVRL